MIARDVVRAAALLAARHAWSEIPEQLVRWAEDSQSQAESDTPQVTLSSVSHVPEGPVSLRRTANSDGELAQRMLQTWIWTVQFKIEGWKLDSVYANNPIAFAHKMRFGWYLQTVRAALLDVDSRESERCPVKMVEEVGQLLTVNQPKRGHTLPVHVYEIEFRYVARDADPTPVGVLESVGLSGTLGGVPVTLIATPES